MRMLVTGGRVLAARAAQVVIIAVCGMVVARVLGPAGQGHYSLTVALIMLAAAILNGGVGLAGVPLLRAGEIRLGRLLRAQWLWIAAAAVVLGAVGLILRSTGAMGLFREYLGWSGEAAAGTLVAIAALLSFEIFFYDLLAEGRIATGPVINLGRATLHLGILLFLNLNGRLHLGGAVIAYAVAQLCALFTVAVLLGRRCTRPAKPAGVDPRSLSTVVGLLLRRGWVGQVSAIASLLHLRLNLALVGVFWSASVVGIYSIAVQVGELLWLLPGALSPMLVYAAADRTAGAERDRLTARAMRVGLIATAAAALPLGLLARPLLTLVFGQEYADSAPALQALLPGIVLFAPGAVLAGDFIGRGHPGWNTVASLLTVTVNVVAGLLLIPTAGAMGAALASTIAYTCGSTLMFLRFLRATGLAAGEVLRPRRGDFRP